MQNMAKTDDISSRIQLLQEKLAKENETRDSVIPQTGQSKRPNNCKDLLTFWIFVKFLLIFVNIGISFAWQCDRYF